MGKTQVDQTHQSIPSLLIVPKKKTVTEIKKEETERNTSESEVVLEIREKVGRRPTTLNHRLIQLLIMRERKI